MCSSRRKEIPPTPCCNCRALIICRPSRQAVAAFAQLYGVSPATVYRAQDLRKPRLSHRADHKNHVCFLWHSSTLLRNYCKSNCAPPINKGATFPQNGDSAAGRARHETPQGLVSAQRPAAQPVDAYQASPPDQPRLCTGSRCRRTLSSQLSTTAGSSRPPSDLKYIEAPSRLTPKADPP